MEFDLFNELLKTVHDEEVEMQKHITGSCSCQLSSAEKRLYQVADGVTIQRCLEKLREERRRLCNGKKT